MVHLTPVCLSTHILIMCLQGKVLSHYFTTKQYRIKRFFLGVHACVHGADALTHTFLGNGHVKKTRYINSIRIVYK